MKVVECLHIRNRYTVLVFADDLPLRAWQSLVIDGESYNPVPVMDSGDDCVAIADYHDFTGKDVTFE